MIFVGDVHGAFEAYADLIDLLPATIQLGDMGLGFGRNHLFDVGPEHRFIRGNHDNPADCAKSSNFLGDFGYLTAEDIFFVSGASSIDRSARIPFVSWWPDEELSTTQMNAALELYSQVRPGIVASHDCPFSMYDKFVKRPRPDATTKFLDALMAVHKPDAWFFAHHHKSKWFKRQGVQFYALRTLEVVALNDL